MIEKTTTTKMISVTNRDNGEVACLLSNGRVINFNQGQTKNVSLDDLLELKSTDGGTCLLKEYLVINDKDALAALDMEDVEPEYYYSEKEVRKLLSEGTLEQLEDCLNFAPGGVIDIVKDIALEIELPDTRKRKLLMEKIGFDLDSVLRVKQVLDTPAPTKEDTKKERKATPVTVDNSGAPKRKAAPVVSEIKKEIPEYKVVSIDKES